MNDVALTSTRNFILLNLETEERDRLWPRLEHQRAMRGQYLQRSGDPITHLYFPDYSMVSVVGGTRQGNSAEIGIIGNEGLVGVDALLGAGVSPNDTMVQLPDGIFCLPVADGLREFERGGGFQKSVLYFVHRLMVQISQTAVCNAIHGLEERLARWLLMCRDRAPGDTIHLTQEFLSFMVGTTRASVTLAAITLQDLEYISYKRGEITIRDRAGLIDFACDCYGIVKVP